MKKFNLKKRASSDDFVISDKGIKENREKMNLSNSQQGVVGKNINLSLPVKDKDNTVPFNAQLDAERKNAEAEPSITEAHMDKKEVDFKSKDKKQVMDINVESQKLDNEKTEAFKKAEVDKDTDFWDKYVGVQLEEEGQPTKIKNNISESASQLQNQPDRFKGEKVDKMVMASVKDADAMLFHIYATASKEGRDLSDNEKQQVTDINSGKIRLMSQIAQPVKRTLGNNGDPVIKDEGGVVRVYEQDGTPIDEFKSCEDARANYPEGDIG
jgi:hypothetical protein